MKPADLLTVWPTKVAIAKAFEVTPSSVTDWFNDGVIPRPRQFQAEVLSNRKLRAPRQVRRGRRA